MSYAKFKPLNTLTEIKLVTPIRKYKTQIAAEFFQHTKRLLGYDEIHQAISINLNTEQHRV